MKKGIKANLYLPKECLDILCKREEEVVDYFENCFSNLTYNIYLGEYQGKEVCGIDIQLLNRTCSLVNEDYRHFKEYLKEITGKKPKQILMFKYDKIF